MAYNLGDQPVTRSTPSLVFYVIGGKYARISAENLEVGVGGYDFLRGYWLTDAWSNNDLNSLCCSASNKVQCAYFYQKKNLRLITSPCRLFNHSH